MPKISIVTVSRNASKTIESTLRSVKAQNNADFEHIIIDGKSVDGTMNVVDHYRDGLSTIISEPDNGIFDAMNKGLNIARGEFIGYLNADDYFLSSSSLSYIQRFLERSGVDCVWGDVVQVDQDGRPRRLINGAWFEPARLKYGFMPPHPSLYCRTETLRSMGGFALDYKLAADFDLIVRMLQNRALRWAYINKPVVAMRLGGASTQGLASTRLVSSEVVRSLRQNGISKSHAKVQLRYALKAFEVLAGHALFLRGKRFPPDAGNTFGHR